MLRVTLTVKSPPAAATLCSFLSTENTTAAPDCRTETVFLTLPSEVETVMEPVLDVNEVFSVTPAAIVASPFPLSESRVIHSASLVITQSVLEVTFSISSPLLAENSKDSGLTVNDAFRVS